MNRKPALLVTVCLAALTINLDTTIVNVALPSLARELDADTRDLLWVVDGYNLAFAALVLAMGSPSVLEERASEYFDLPSPSPFMLLTVPVRPSAKGLIPAVVHVDGSARVQTVDATSNPRYRLLLETFGRQTGVPVLLNTSFNVNEPIVCTPDEAINCFLRTEVEWLVLGNLLVPQPTALGRDR